MKCDGACEHHNGDIVRVEIADGHFSGLQFNYCQEAIIEDERRGIKLIINPPTILTSKE